jgi:tetraacyldisaccharide 4'-kinase
MRGRGGRRAILLTLTAPAAAMMHSSRAVGKQQRRVCAVGKGAGYGRASKGIHSHKMRPIGTLLRAPAFWDAPRSLLSDAVLPLSMIYAAATRLRDACARPPMVAPAPVVCVGSVLVGGSGKTPVALALGQRLAAQRPSLAVHYLSRGYGGTAAGPLRVQPGMHEAAEVGDEPLLLAVVAPTWVGRRRSDSATAACASGAQLLIMDDGLQHPLLHRDLSLLCVDRAYLLGNGRVLPAGPLREPAARGYAKADAVVALSYPCDDAPSACSSNSPSSLAAAAAASGGGDFTGCNALASAEELRKRLGMPDELPLLLARLEPDAEAAARIARKRVVAFSGTARPQRFFDTLTALGCELVRAPLALPDHSPIDARTLQSLQREASVHGALLVTTSKDAARLTASERAGLSCLSATIRWLEGSESALDELLGPLARRACSPP